MTSTPSGEKSPSLPTPPIVRNSIRISLPMGLEHVVICGAQIMTTVIVAPLGIPAIAANSFAITAESLCYMPGYGIADAATTLVGQSLGAGRRRLTRRFAYITVFMVFLADEMSKTNLPVFSVSCFADEISCLRIDITETYAWFDDGFCFLNRCTNKVMDCGLFFVYALAVEGSCHI